MSTVTNPHFTYEDSQKDALTGRRHARLRTRLGDHIELVEGRMYEFRYLYQGEERFIQREFRAKFIDVITGVRSGWPGGSLMLSGRPLYGTMDMPIAHLTQITEYTDPNAQPTRPRKVRH
jgi:hypothetical protein